VSAPAFGTIGTLLGSTTSTPAFAVPASVASGDIIVVAFFADVSTTTISAFPSGFAAAENSPRTINAGGAGNCALHVAWKRATGADSGTYGFTLSASVFVYGNAVRYTGCVASGNPWDSPTSAADGGSTGSTTTPDVNVTTADVDRILFFAGVNVAGDGGTWTAPSGFSQRQGGASTTNCEISDKVQAAQGASGNTHATNTLSGTVGAWMGALIGTTVSGAVPWNPQRYSFTRDYGEVQWAQRDLRNAHLVATAANPLPSPLDVAYGADGCYSHLNDVAQRFTFVPYSQRDRRDANTVATAANPLPSPLDSAWQADARYWHLYSDFCRAPQQPFQRAYVSDPNLLTVPATDPLTLAAGVGGDTWRRYNLPDFTPRWWMPEQPKRDGYTPGLLDAALLENELLGGAETPKRYFLPATHVDRREVPQQRAYVSDPLLLTTAELENELLGGAETAKRTNMPATHVPRWWMPAQPNRWSLFFDAGPDAPPLTLSWGVDGRYSTLYGQPAWQPDRREVPQQRLYISDPSFYPTTPPTDPLTVAWGEQGNYWHLYNTAATHVDRREVPQQRLYVSDPLLLTTALLENELLGSADDRWRRYGQWFADRREVPQQRAYVSDPNLLGAPSTDPLTLAAGVGGDTWRRYNAPAYGDRRQVPQQRGYISDLTMIADADPLTLTSDTWRYFAPAYYDRREVPQQPPRRTLYFDQGPDSPPLTLAWGAGGAYWHSYQWRREARSWWQPRPVFMVLGEPCTTLRPTSGTTAEALGNTARPFTGITKDECH